MIQIGELIDDRYRVTRVLGEGGMAMVYEAKDIITRKTVAIKIIKDEVMKNPMNLTRFEREARACAALDHQNIVRVINLGTYQGKPYMANEFIKGQTLRDVLDNRTRYPFLEACDVMFQLCGAVAHAHSHLVIHRDIKPQNVYMMADGTVKLGDFGIATFENSSRVTKSEVIVGSVHYMAPEISQGKPASFQSDIYSLGITFFEVITGRVPFDNATPIAVALAHVKEKFPSPRKFLPTTPKAIEKIIMKACRKNPADRYRNVGEMQRDIRHIIENPKLIKPRRSLASKIFGFATED
ncbi:MAG: protein kinase [Firmicutes bacterium]|nr:protein kinase [Bacillota bacterium]